MKLLFLFFLARADKIETREYVFTQSTNGKYCVMINVVQPKNIKETCTVDYEPTKDNCVYTIRCVEIKN